MEGGDNVSHNHNHHHHPNMQHPAMGTTNLPQQHPAMGTTNLPQQQEGEGEAPPRPPGKVENGVNSTDPWGDGSGAALNKGGLVVPPLVETQGAPPPPSVVSQAAETPGGGGGGGGVSVKVATTVLHPLCLGEGPVVLPIHLQMAGATGAPPMGQMGATPYFMTSQGPLSLPLVLDPQLLQHLSSQMASGCGALPLQNNVLCQNASLTFGLPPPPPPPLPPPPPPHLDQKSSGGSSSPDSNLLSLLQNPAFAAILQDLFSSQAAAAASSACQSPGSGAPPPNADPFTSFFTSPTPPHAPPPPLSHPYASSSPLAPLVPPPTLLVPYPVVIPLPVPLPIPLPIPVPVNVPHHHHQAQEDSKGNVVPPRAPPVCTVSRSTQTCTREATSSSSSSHSSHSFSHRFAVAPSQPPPHAAPPPQCSSSPEGEVLDLSVARVVKQPKQEFPPSPPLQQDNVLDLSVSGSAKQKKYIQPSCVASAATSTSLGAGGGDGREFAACHQQAGPEPPPLSLAVLGDSKLLSGLASLEFSRQHKWLAVDASSGVACSAGGSQGMMASLGGGGGVAMGPAAEGNLEIVSASSHSTAKVIVSVKDAIPAAILCGKIKGLSGVSTKNFSIKRDGAVGIPAVAALQKLYGAPPSSSSGPPGGVGGVGGPEQQQQQQQHDPSDLLGRKAPKNRAIKVKKVHSSQEIHFLPIKKQRLAAFLPRK